MNAWFAKWSGIAVVALILASTGQARAAPLLSDAELQSELSKLAGHKLQPPYFEDKLSKLKLPLPSEVLARAVADKASPEAAVALFASSFQMNATAARALLTATLVKAASRTEKTDERLTQYARVLEALVLSAREAPGHLVPGAILLTDYELWKNPEAAQRLMEVLRASPSPSETALALIPAAGAGWSLSLWAFAVGERPELLPRALEAMDTQPGDESDAAFIFSALQSEHLPTDAALRRGMKEGLLRQLLKDDYPELGLQLLESLPPVERAALRLGRWKVREFLADWNGDGVQESHVVKEDVRPDIAAAYLARGDVMQARAWFLATKTAAVEVHSDDPYECRNQVKQTLLEARLGDPTRHAPFTLRMQTDCVPGTVPWMTLYASVLSEQYPQRARQLLENARRHIQRQTPTISYGSLPLPFLRPAETAFNGAMAQRLERLQQALARLPPAEPASRPTPAEEAAFRARLRQYPATPFREQAATANASPRKQPAPVEATQPRPLNLPRGFRSIVVQNAGPDRRVVVAESQRLDPIGELSGGAYWLLMSHDGGSTWPEVLYTGLRPYQPYVLSTQGQGPILVGDTLRLDLELRKVEPGSITFPPVSLDFERDMRARTFEATLSELKRDTDGDSLPDVVEARLLLDPARADTDGDGLKDAVDPVPRLARSDSRPGDARAAILSQFFFFLSEKQRPRSLVTTRSESTEEAPRGLQEYAAPTSLEDTWFVVAPPDLLQGVNSPLRLVSMTDWEAEMAREHFGIFYPLELDLAFNAAGDQAYLEWHERWRGGALLARRRPDGTWELTPLGSWVT